MAASTSADLLSPMSGTWKPDLKRSDDFEPFLLEVGVPWAIRKLIKRSTPETVMTVTSDGFSQKTLGAMGKTMENGGKFGTEVDWTSPGGTDRRMVDLVDGKAIRVSGKSPSPKDPDGTMFTLMQHNAEDDTIRLCLSINRGDGTTLVINRVLVRIK